MLGSESGYEDIKPKAINELRNNDQKTKKKHRMNPHTEANLYYSSHTLRRCPNNFLQQKGERFIALVQN